MTLNRWYAPSFLLLLASAPAGWAQSSLDVNIGFGTARVGSNGAGLDNAFSPNAFGPCAPSAADPNCQANPGLSGFLLGLGANAMLYKHFGVGAELNLQPSKNDYGPLQFRQTFYDFNGIYEPVHEKRVLLQLEGGIGGARTSFSVTQNACLGTAVCSTSMQPVGTSNHFQVHTGVGLQVFLTNRLFIRPEFDLHYVPNLTQQFGSNSVPEGMIWVGYSFGGER